MSSGLATWAGALASARTRRRFAAMGTDVALVVYAPEAAATPALAVAEAEVRRLEGVFSRFRADSELSRLNDAGGGTASDDMVAVVLYALDARRRTGGRFDPTVHDALVAAGYDRTFELVQSAPPAPWHENAPPCGGRVEVDAVTRTIRLGPGVRLDLGGIVKGYAAERACDLLAAAGPCLVDLGGDIAVRGCPPAGEWSIDVDTADGTVNLGIPYGAFATSGRDRRLWAVQGGRRGHHLIDPRHGRPAETDLLRVTVAAGSAVEAEVQAKALFLAGSIGAAAEANAAGLPALLVTEDGRTIRAGGMP